MEAIQALGKIGDARTVEALVIALKDETSSNEIHAAVTSSLGRIGDVRAVEPLISVLKGVDINNYYSRVIIQSLAQIGDRRACEPIIEVLFRSLDEGYAWQRDYFQPLHHLFADYTELITDVIGFAPEYMTIGVNYGSYTDRVLRECNVERNQKALDQLCNINTPVSNNILNLINNFQAMTLDKICKPHFDGLGRRAKEELIRRKNPRYDPSEYLETKAWMITEHLCPKCGSPLSDNAIRCGKCGYKFV
jgi:ribosomal protein L40E